MNVLALDTASPSAAIALATAGGVATEPLAQDRRASEALLPALNALLRRGGVALENISRIAVCSGPGSFTGVRIGLATAWGLGRALSIPVESLSTLEAMAEAARAPGLERVAAVLDAGHREIVVEFFELTADRAQSTGPIERWPLEEAAARLDPQATVCLPPDLLEIARLALSVCPAAAAARAVARSPREKSDILPAAIYARPSAAEEKRGAS